MVVRLFAFVRFYPRNIAFESANSLGLSLKLITSWRTLSTEPSSTFVSFSLSRAQSRTISTLCLQPAETFLGLSEGDGCAVGRVRFHLEAHFLFSGILPISDCFARCMPCTNKSKKEVPLSGRTFDFGECDSLQGTYRWIAVCFGVFRVLRAKERENEIVFVAVVVVGLIDRVPRPVDCEWRRAIQHRGYRGTLIAGCQTWTCD